MFYDAIVVGSGPGGAAAATRLAQHGKSVLLVDRQAFPRDKVCGDALPLAVIDMMINDLHIDIQHSGLHYQPIRGLSVAAPSGKSILIASKEKLNQIDFSSMAAPRLSFDLVLHQNAIRTGARFEVMDIVGPLLSPDGKRVMGVIERRGKAMIEHEAHAVIAADGATSAIVRGVRGRVSDIHDTAIAIRAYARLNKPMPDNVYLDYMDYLIPGYGWIFPVGEDRANIGIGLFRQDVYKQRRQSLKVLLDHYLENLADRFDFELELDTARSWPIPVWTSLESRFIKNTYLVGDAGRFVDALTGGGIHSAMRTGLLAAEAVIRQLAGLEPAAAGAGYDQAWRQIVGPDLRRNQLIQNMIASRRRVMDAVISVTSSYKPIQNFVARALSGQHT